MIGLTLFENHQSELDAFAFGIMEQMFTHIHETATCLNKDTSSFEFNLANLRSDEILSGCHLSQG